VPPIMLNQARLHYREEIVSSTVQAFIPTHTIYFYEILSLFWGSWYYLNR
jgi:hypothetical protein